jgi:predicted outer membrane repeat protein
MNRHLPAALAFATSAALGAGLALSSVPAYAGGSHPHTRPPAQVVTPRAPLAPGGKALTRPTPGQLKEIRARQQRIAAGSKAPAFAKAGSTTFTVDTTEDSGLASAGGTTCVDAATGACSLRAAVDASNNLAKPVTVELGAHVYTLSQAAALEATNPSGTSIVGKGSHRTTVRGDGSGVFSLDPSSVQAPALLFVTGAKITGGSAQTGGGINLNGLSTGSTAVLDHVIVSGNSATTSGGGIYASPSNTVYARNTTISGNQAPYGGGVYAWWGDVNLTDVTVSGNHSPGTEGYGGGLYTAYGVVRMKGGSITGNTAGDSTYQGQGGGVYDFSGNVALTDVHVDHNPADGGGGTHGAGGSGGGIFAYDDVFAVDGGTVSHNHANGSLGGGGGLYQAYSAQVDLHGVRMAGNRLGGPVEQGYGGGALYLYGSDGYGNQTTIDRGTTVTGSNGSAIYAYAYDGVVDLRIGQSTLSDNHSTDLNAVNGLGCGGAICANGYYVGTVNVSMTGNTVERNSSTGDTSAGAVEIVNNENSAATVKLRRNRFASNDAGPGGWGGAVLFYDNFDVTPISVRSQANTFVRNRAGTSAVPGQGGAMAIYGYATFTDKRSTFSRNIAAGDGAYGGAISDKSFQSVRFIRTTFTGNRAGPTDSGDGYGGAVYDEDQYGSAYDKVTITGNRAASYGGGVYSGFGYATSFEESTISGNTAGTSSGAGYGGGIYVIQASLLLENSTLADNTARSVSGSLGAGGGLYATDGSTTGVRFSTVSGNVAEQGGGIYYASLGGALMGSIVSRNHASVGGAEQDCSSTGAPATAHSLGGNVLGQAACVTARQPSDTVSRHLHLGALADNGGPTRTMAITAASPAVGRASFQVPDSDQRGHDRPAKHADSGAFELAAVKHHH